MRRPIALAAVAIPGLLGLGIGAPAAVAADDCPNAAVRGQQVHASSLPNCFAYERVTGSDKNGGVSWADSAMAADGSIISMRSTVPLLDDDVSGHTRSLVATRGTDGWSLRTLLTNSPDWGKIRLSMVGDLSSWGIAADDFSAIVYRAVHPLAPGDLGNGPLYTTPDLYLSKPSGSHVWISAPVSGTVTGTQAGSEPVPWRASSDLSRVIFSTSRVLDPEVDATVREHLWLFREGQRLEAIDRLPDGSPSTATSRLHISNFWAAQKEVADRRSSLDGRTVVFVSSSLHGREHVYARTGVGTPDARTVLVSADAGGAPCPAATTFGHITESGRYVRFTCAAPLTPDAPPAGGAYVRDLETGAVSFDEPMADRGDPVVEGHATMSWTRPEGTYRVAWRSQGGKYLVFRTDLATGVEECVTCLSDGSPSEGRYGGVETHAQGGAGGTVRGLVSPQGEVVFVTEARLVPEDVNAFNDVYMWKDGRHHLLSSGNAASDVNLGGMSLDGSTITFSTSASLVPDDRDGGQRDVYALRRGGGFLRPAEPAACTTGCQGPAVPVSPPLRPLSLDFSGVGNVRDDSLAPIGVSGSRTVRGTSLKVKVKVPATGRVSVSGSGLRSTSRSLKRAVTATMTVRLSTRSQRLLRRKGTVRVKATVRFVPADGAAQSQRVNLTFRKAKAKTKTKTKKKGTSRSAATATSGRAVR